MFMYVHTCTFVRAGDSGPHHAGASGANWAVLLLRNLQLANKRLWTNFLRAQHAVYAHCCHGSAKV